MRNAIARSAIPAAGLALAVGCTGEHGVTIGPSHSTEQPAGGSTASEPAGTEAAGVEDTGIKGSGTTGSGTKGSGAEAAGTGTTATGGRRPASVGPGADIAASAMLQPADWPDGRLRVEKTGIAALPQTEPSACEPRTAYPSDRYRHGARTRTIYSDLPESGGVYEVAVRYSAGRAEQAMTEMRRVLAACRTYPSQDPHSPGATVSYRLERQRFVGDDSLLVLRSLRPTSGRVQTAYISVVRIGDALLTTTSDGGEATAFLNLGLRLAGTGARRAACLRSGC